MTTKKSKSTSIRKTKEFKTSQLIFPYKYVGIKLCFLYLSVSLATMSLSNASATNISHASSNTKQQLAEKGYSRMFDTTAALVLV